MNILVVAAHPDDELLGGGGTFARHARDGHDVYLAVLGEGMTSRSDRREDTDPDTVTELHEHGRNAARVLGARDRFQYDLPDNRFDSVPLLDVVKVVEDLVERLQPQIVFTHHGGDLNVDHQVTERAVLTATRTLQGSCVRDVYAFETPSSTEWTFQKNGLPFEPNVFVDISDTLETKINSFACYETEVREFPHPRSPEAIEAIARRWGSVCGCRAAEAFMLIRSVRR